MHCSGLKYLRNDFTVLEMALEFYKAVKYVGNDLNMLEKA